MSKRRIAGKLTLSLTLVLSSASWAGGLETGQRGIAVPCAYFIAEPFGPRHLKNYVIKDDFVRLIAANEDWLEDEYQSNGGKAIKGWIQAIETKFAEPRVGFGSTEPRARIIAANNAEITLGLPVPNCCYDGTK